MGVCTALSRMYTSHVTWRMSLVTYMNESRCCVSGITLLYRGLHGPITPIIQSCRTYERVMSHVWLCHRHGTAVWGSSRPWSRQTDAAWVPFIRVKWLFRVFDFFCVTCPSHIYKCIYRYIYIYEYTHEYMNEYTCIYRNIYLYTNIYVSIYRYIYIYIYMYICIYIYV